MQAGADRAVAALAASQHGAFGIRQAADRGVTDKERRVRVARGQWAIAAHGVLVIAGSPRTWRQELMVATLRTRGTISARAATVLNGLDGVRGEPREILLARSSHARVPGFTVHRTLMLDPADVTRVDGIPTTNIARTLCDLGAVVDDDTVEAALDAAVRMGCSMRWIIDTLDRVDRPGNSGTASLRRVLARPDRAGRTPDSRFERIVQRAIVGAALPQPVRQHPVFDREGKLLGKIDVAWPDLKLGIEATSKRWHSALNQVRRDLARDAAITDLDWKLLYPEWRDAIDPATFVEITAREYRVRALARRRPA
jgi:hypothetical protein